MLGAILPDVRSPHLNSLAQQYANDGKQWDKQDENSRIEIKDRLASEKEKDRFADGEKGKNRLTDEEKENDHPVNIEKEKDRLANKVKEKDRPANKEKNAKLNNNPPSSVWRLLVPHLEPMFFEFKLSRRVLVWLFLPSAFIGLCFLLMGYGYGSGEL